MALENTLTDERLLTLARERQGFFKGKPGFYIGIIDRGDDRILLSPIHAFYRDELLRKAQFGIHELGLEGMHILDLAQIQMHDIIAGPFESHTIARDVLPYVVKVRYLWS